MILISQQILRLIDGGALRTLADLRVEGGGSSMPVNFPVGITGTLIRGWLDLFRVVHRIGSGVVGLLITALVGAVILLFVMRFFSTRRNRHSGGTSGHTSHLKR